MGGSNPIGPSSLAPGPEFDRIRALLSGRGADSESAKQVRVGPGDDCAALVTGDLVVSTDLAMEGVHFKREWLTPEQIGYRSVTAALSDLAAVAAAPVAVLVSLAAPSDLDGSALEALGQGIGAACARVGAAWIGGDLSASSAGLVIDATVLGRTSEPVLRSGARPGDELWVTGHLGGAAAAVQIWNQGRTPHPELLAAFARPSARIAEARWLHSEAGMTALIDISDGLAGDARHLAQASRVRITLHGSAVPVSPAAERAVGPPGVRALALFGGEDYELCFAAPAGNVEPLAPEFTERFSLSLTQIGTVERGSGVYVRGRPGERAEEVGPEAGFEHFTDEAEAP